MPPRAAAASRGRGRPAATQPAAESSVSASGSESEYSESDSTAGPATPKRPREEADKAKSTEPEFKKQKPESLNGTPPVRLPQWKELLDKNSIMLGPKLTWGPTTTYFMTSQATGDKANFQIPPGVVYQSFLGLGRSPPKEEDGPKNYHQIDLCFGESVLSDAVRQKNPALVDEHRDFVDSIVEFQNALVTMMVTSGKFKPEMCASKRGMFHEIFQQVHRDWPAKESLLDRGEMLEILMRNGIGEHTAANLADASGLLSPGGASDSDDAEARERIVGNPDIAKAEREKYERQINEKVVQHFMVDGMRPLVEVSEDANGKPMAKISFRRKVMFLPKATDKTDPGKSRKFADASDQTLWDLTGAGPYKMFGVKIFAPPRPGKPAGRLFEKEQNEHPAINLIGQGDLVRFSFNLRAYAPGDKSGLCGIKAEPNFGHIILDHQATDEEGAALFPSMGAASISYDLAPTEYVVRGGSF